MKTLVRLVLFAAFGALLGLSFSTTQAHPLPASCDINNPPTCLYTSDLNYSVGVVDTQLTDASRNNYKIPLRIRYPIGLAGPRPVVIWNHGGAPSAKGKTRSEEWGNLLAAAGYVVIHPSRTKVKNIVPFLNECTTNGFPSPGECVNWVSNYYYGPQNTRFLIDNFAAIENADAALAGMLDETKIVVGGHSAGSTTVLANAGAFQQWVKGGKKYNTRVDAPIAFMASGPQGPLYAGFNSGFQSTSYEAIDRPFLFMTGMGDETGEPSEARVTGWLRSLPGNKALSWDTEKEAVHETMNIHKCDTVLRANHCGWIGSVGLAYLDAVVRQRAEAMDWMKSPALKVLSGGEIELHLR